MRRAAHPSLRANCPIRRGLATAIETSNRFTEQGKPVRYIRSTFVPGEGHCMCLFEAPNAALVREVNETAKIPFTRIVEAADLTPK